MGTLPLATSSQIHYQLYQIYLPVDTAESTDELIHIILSQETNYSKVLNRQGVGIVGGKKFPKNLKNGGGLE